MLRPTLSIALALLTWAAGAQGQTVSWISPGTPSPRQSPAMAYDVSQHATLLFGGVAGNTIFGDTWLWRGAWIHVTPSVSPSPRMGPAIAFDGAADDIVLFGGSTTSPVTAGSSLADTWTWDGTIWTQQFPSVSPPARTWPTMVYDPQTKSVVLFGGANLAGGDGGFDDTWAWDGIAKTWTQRNPISHPSARASNQLVYDPSTQNVVLFGGVTNNLTSLNDTWTWDGINWTERFPATSPAPRNGPGLAYDGGLRAVVLFGGAVGPCCSNNLNDTWTWDGENWTQVYPANTLPAARNAPGMVYDTSERAVILFGGATAGPLLSDTWLLQLAH